MKRLMLIFNNFNAWRHWRLVSKGKKTIDWTRGPGYYISVGGFSNPKGRTEEFQLNNNEIGIYELLDYATYRDPWDMIEYSKWHLQGYKTKKLIKDCTFEEFVDIYGKAIRK
jgi:hypothetical protein